MLAVVAAGLYLGHRSPRRQTAATRLQGTEVWRVIEFLLESVVFALIGLQLPDGAGRAAGGLDRLRWWRPPWSRWR